MTKSILFKAIAGLVFLGTLSANATETVIADFTGQISGFTKPGTYQTVSTTSANAGTRYTTENGAGVEMLIYGSMQYPMAKYTGNDLYLRTNGYQWSAITAAFSDDISFVGSPEPVEYSISLSALNAANPRFISLYLGESTTIDGSNPFKNLATALGVLLDYSSANGNWTVKCLNKANQAGHDISSQYISTQTLGTITTEELLAAGDIGFTIETTEAGTTEITIFIGETTFDPLEIVEERTVLYDNNMLTLYAQAIQGNSNATMEMALSEMAVKVIPEPAAASALIGLLALALCVAKRRK